MLLFSDLAAITQGKVLQMDHDQAVSHLLIDSRKPVLGAGTIFFAIPGPQHDGHSFLDSLYAKGIRNFVVEAIGKDSIAQLPQANILQVPSTIKALQAIAGWHRRKFDLAVVAITGSNAKTIIKEWLWQLLSPAVKLVKSPKSYNSQVGVPLSAWLINDTHEMGIFEAGISMPNEMEHLAKILLPDIGIFTNLGTAHEAGFKSQQQKLEEKIKLFETCSTIIYCLDHHDVHAALSARFPMKRLFSWSWEQDATVKVAGITKLGTNSQLAIQYKGTDLSLSVPFTDRASLENCLHCIAFLLQQDHQPDFIQSGLNQLEGIPRRLMLKKGINQCYLVDDTYNNDLAGLEIALDFLNQQPQRERKTVILSDLFQFSETEEAVYQAVADLLRSQDVDRLIGIGSRIKNYQSLFQTETQFFESTDDFLSSLSRVQFVNELILVKGARAFTFEKITEKLQEKIHRTVLEINLDALTHNLNYYKSKLHPHTKIMVMVKAFAYGSGSFEVAHLLQYHGVSYLGVAYPDEGIALRQNGIQLPIMVMNPHPESFDQLVSYNLEPEIYSLELLQSLGGFIGSSSTGIKIHIKLDTGMHRLGFELPEMDRLIELLVKHPNIEVASLFSHLATAGDPAEINFSKEQYQRLQQAVKILNEVLPKKPLVHLLNSAGILQLPEYQMDMVRLGIGLYGIGGNQDHLQPIGTLKSTISQIKEIEKGDTIGYGRQGKATEPMKIATVAMGYADGFDRRFGNGKGQVLVKGKTAPVVGNVCMDMTMIDVTDISVEPGDEVIIFNQALSVQSLAQQIGTIPYEILTNISERVKRNYFSE